ncbi:14962_t:CDS:2 [Racocetra fulgida]|uniref:14962_t:CDS:1 n=1 Tax=Racocetra fulgida TaxID=60492 RepID=A0A9N8Z022_9GLOM|nr:14962_t:CDS:2 [Racocetra fulgida]
MGSGTTAAACKELGRNFIGSELDKEYFQKASARLEKLNVSKSELELGKDDLPVLIAEAEAHISKLAQEIIVDESKTITKDYAMLDKRLLSKKQTKGELEKIVQKWKGKLSEINREKEGKLIVSDLPNLEKIECGNNNFTSIELANLPKLTYFNANNCQLTEIKIENCPEINYFNASNNHLNNTGFLDSLNPEKLTTLSIHSNNFPEQTLETFAKFINLQQLFLDNNDKAKFRKGIYNRFIGSLKPLQNLTKLEILSIGVTDIDSGLEYLPKSLRKIGLTSAIKVDTGCSKIRQELEEVAKIEGNYSPEIRKNITFLTINDKNLKGHLDLRDFTKLEKLDCSDNQLTNLDLSQCAELTHLYCENNSLTSLDFLNTLPNKDKLKEIYLGDNPELHSQNLDFLTPFTELEELNIENCPFSGSLKSLKSIGKLKNIYISDTDIDSGLDDLPTNCQRVYCSNNKADRKELKAKIGKEEIKKPTELSKLKSPEQFGRFKYLTGIEYASTSTTVIGGALTLLDFSTTGGVITLTAPLVGQGAKEFEKDADTFLENFNELMGILKQIEAGEVGTVSEALEDLKKQVYKFLNAYDEDRNEEIDIKELTNGRVKFAKELNKVEEIVEAMKELEEQVINYRQDQVPIVNELLQKLTNIKEGKREKIEKIFKEEFPKKEIKKIIFSERGENKEQYLIISNEVLNDSIPKYYLNLVDLIIINNAFYEAKMNNFSQPFSSEEEAKKLIKIEFTEEQERRIENELKKLYQEKEAKELIDKQSITEVQISSEQKGESSAQAQIEIPPKIKARNTLHRVLENAQSEGEKMGVVKAFEFCYELSWKILKKILNFHSIEVGSARDVFREATKQIIRQILSRYPYRFYAYGSRVKGTARKFSDLDLCYQEEMPWNIYGRVKEDFEESNLPFKVDLVF